MRTPFGVVKLRDRHLWVGRQALQGEAVALGVKAGGGANDVW